MSSIPRHTTRRLSRCYWRFEDRAHRALCLESRVLSGARDDVDSMDSFAGGCVGVGFDSRVDANTVFASSSSSKQYKAFVAAYSAAGGDRRGLRNMGAHGEDYIWEYVRNRELSLLRDKVASN
uniref:SFRICE_030577 n=1 Tax=Spodoptera frugiperda TaxID=7108 RepID=A0A2H1VQG6_SPOFR